MTRLIRIYVLLSLSTASLIGSVALLIMWGVLFFQDRTPSLESWALLFGNAACLVVCEITKRYGEYNIELWKEEDYSDE